MVSEYKSHDKPQWFLIYTKPRQEVRARENLKNQGNEVFLPMIACDKNKELKSLSLKPMFPRYLFTKFTIESKNWMHVNSTRGVSHIVVFGDNPSEVPNSIIDYLKRKVDENDIFKLENKRRRLQKGEEIVIKEGLFQGIDATFLSMSGKERVRIMLNLMNQLLITDMPGQNIERKAIAETFKL